MNDFKFLMMVVILFIALRVLVGCAPTPFVAGERTTAPYGYTDMIKREAR